MTGGEHPWQAWLWLALTTVAGAIASLGVHPSSRPKGWKQAMLALAVSAGFAASCGPFVAEQLNALFFGRGAPINLRLYGMVMFLMGTSAPLLIPVVVDLIRKRVKAFGENVPPSSGREP